ncbi:MAG: hypothetical protein KDA70_11555 [Planctomycetaceae bacterium]|nr:hypothetical protein [Planctomycetaceae bacterium]
MVLSYGGELDGDEVLAKLSNLPYEQIEFVPEVTLETVNSIERGILYLMAFWSDLAMKGFATLTKELNQHDTKHLRIVVADVDGASNLNQLKEVSNSINNGDGNTLWIRNGKVLATLTPISGGWDQLKLKNCMSQLDIE